MEKKKDMVPLRRARVTGFSRYRYGSSPRTYYGTVLPIEYFASEELPPMPRRGYWSADNSAPDMTLLDTPGSESEMPLSPREFRDEDVNDQGASARQAAKLLKEQAIEEEREKRDRGIAEGVKGYLAAKWRMIHPPKKGWSRETAAQEAQEYLVAKVSAREKALQDQRDREAHQRFTRVNLVAKSVRCAECGACERFEPARVRATLYRTKMESFWRWVTEFQKRHFACRESYVKRMEEEAEAASVADLSRRSS